MAPPAVSPPRRIPGQTRRATGPPGRRRRSTAASWRWAAAIQPCATNQRVSVTGWSRVRNARLLLVPSTVALLVTSDTGAGSLPSTMMIVNGYSSLLTRERGHSGPP
eukprot:5624189-Pyramimonas_sp.AAC.1